MDTRSPASFNLLTQNEAQHRSIYLLATITCTSLFAGRKPLLGSKGRAHERNMVDFRLEGWV
jgi:hypothetical protein